MVVRSRSCEVFYSFITIFYISMYDMMIQRRRMPVLQIDIVRTALSVFNSQMVI
jgi:hypothetical protein